MDFSQFEFAIDIGLVHVVWIARAIGAASGAIFTAAPSAIERTTDDFLPLFPGCVFDQILIHWPKPPLFVANDRPFDDLISL